MHWSEVTVYVITLLKINYVTYNYLNLGQQNYEQPNNDKKHKITDEKFLLRRNLNKKIIIQKGKVSWINSHQEKLMLA